MAVRLGDRSFPIASTRLIAQAVGENLLNAEDQQERCYEREAKPAAGRIPSEAEIAAATGLVRDTIASLPSGDDDGKQLRAWSGLCQSLMACAEFRYLQ